MTKDAFDKTTAQSLTEIVDNQPGVDSQDYCVNCGARRLTINGLKAEHTSILVDGIPLYSAVSSVYGLDTIPPLAIEEIEVMRGAGSALVNPDSIGGTINIFTLHPQVTGGKVRASLGTRQTQNYEALYSLVGDKTRWSFGGEWSGQRAQDNDHNGVAESPDRDRGSIFLKQTTTFNSKVQWSLRAGHSDLQIVGGNTQKFRPRTVTPTQADELDFVDGDVRKPHSGEISEITDYLHIRRSELTSKLVYILDPRNTLEWNAGASLYRQQSLYMHGFDYDNNNLVMYNDVRWNHQITTEQSLLLGLSARRETLRSDSLIMYDQKGVPRDNFNYLSIAGFVQHEWLFGQGWELSSALRVDQLQNHWLELRRMEKTVVVPRFLLKWAPTEHFTNYFSYGYGYRLPLSFVESAHGTYSDGFIIDVNDLERADSFMLSTGYNTPEFYLTPSVHWTNLKNMAYDLTPAVAHSGPLRFVSAQEDYVIATYELLGGVKPTANWLLEAGYEKFNYENGYKEKLPTAAIENRITLKSNLEWQKYSWNVNAYWIEARDLSHYAHYEDHFNVNEGLLGASSPKRSRAPSFSVWNTSLTRKGERWETTVGVDNIFNYTQARIGDAPAMWHVHDNHAHFDNRHVWGPNRGREVYLRLTYNF